MKKIALIMAMTLFFGMTVAYAEISEGKDTFTGGKTIGSFGKIVDLVDSISLVKNINSKSAEYEFSVSDKGSKTFLFSKTFLEIKVDDNSVHSIQIKRSRVFPTDNPYLFQSGIDVSFPSQIIDEIRDAKRVALRLYRENGLSLVIVLPDNILAEWKQVISTEK